MAKGGFRGMPGGMGGMNQAAMLKQAQKMQQEMLRMQEEQENKTFSAQSGGGMVSATVNGKHELLELKVNPEAVDPEDVEMLQDMIIAAVNQAVNSFIWGIPAMVCIIGVGLLLSVRTGFLQIRKFPYAIRTTVGRMFRKRDASDGAMTPFQAVCTALAGTVGTGNIAGVAGAIAIGGPGAVFWMWCSALLGMCTKFAEVTLAVHFRERSDTGEWVGGPMYYIKNGLGRRWQFLAVLYALFGVLTVFGTGNATQVNTIVAAVDTALLEYGLVGNGFLPTLNLIVGILVAVLVALVLLGGIKRIGSVSEKLVPFMALFYIVLSVGVVVLNFSRLPYVLESIVAGAFNPAAFTGGTIGSLFISMQKGVSRGRSWHRLHRPCLRRHQKAGQAGHVWYF